ncbi:MAG: thioredoxin domain-containing protein, partial [Bradymonadales bacterium]|nr:thioredoxin domain-containing protein [Bradymonadales bacterium]
MPADPIPPTTDSPGEEYELADLPGAAPFDHPLKQRIRCRALERWQMQPAPARHRDDLGRPLYANRLVLETSPYLLQHAHNPVNWFPWGEEAFSLAHELNRPLFLSVGYSTCHWCHVMEQESFEEIDIATVLNQKFIPVKVDREQRPDVDDLYMTAVHLFSGRGGWPMTVVLTPDRIPFFAATYLPPRDGLRMGMPGLLEILEELADLYRRNFDQVEQIGSAARRALERAYQRAPGGDLPGTDVIEGAVGAGLKLHDPRWGGFGTAPKFPQPSLLGFLLKVGSRMGDRQALTAVSTTLEAMRKGGIYDHLGGGFHRYSTDERWLVPHFEKMLYDNAQLATLYLEAYQKWRDPDLLQVTRETLDYLEREMTSPTGGFYSATDADSQGEEGWFFTWTIEEIGQVLSPDDIALLQSVYRLSPQTALGGRGILHLEGSPSGVLPTVGALEEHQADRVADLRRILYQARQQRVLPHLDDKIIASWNGLTIGAFSRAAQVLNEPRYLSLAQRAGQFIAKRMVDRDLLGRVSSEDRLGQTGFLDDYAFVISGFLDLYEACGNPIWLERALSLQRMLDCHFRDPKGGYFLAGDHQEQLVTRAKPAYDGAEPAGNSVAAENLLRLARLLQWELKSHLFLMGYETRIAAWHQDP